MVTFTSSTFGSARSSPVLPHETVYKPRYAAFLSSCGVSDQTSIAIPEPTIRLFPSAGPQYSVPAQASCLLSRGDLSKLHRPPRAFRRGGGELREQGVPTARSNRTDVMSNWMSTTPYCVSNLPFSTMVASTQAPKIIVTVEALSRQSCHRGEIRFDCNANSVPRWRTSCKPFRKI